MSWIDDFNAQAAQNANNASTVLNAPPTWNKWQIQQAQERQQNAQAKLKGQQPPQAKKRNTWLTLIPSALAAGASFVPGVGTGAAAVIGGAGELAAERLNGEKTNWGKIGQEAALSAIPGGLGKIGKVAKIVKGGTDALRVGADAAKVAKVATAANDVSKVANIGADVSRVAKVGDAAATDVATTAAPALSKIDQIRAKVSGVTNNLAIGDNAAQSTTSKIGDKLRATSRGIQVGDKVGKEVLTADAAKGINGAIDTSTKGIIGRTVRGQVAAVQKAKDAAGQELQAAVAASDHVALPSAVKSQAVQDITKGREAILDFNPANAGHVDLNNQYLARLQAAKTPSDILAARQAFDQGASKVFQNPDATQTVSKELAAVYRNAADKMLAAVSPEAKAASTKFATLSQAEKALTSGNKVNASGVKPFGTSINGKGLGGGALQAAQDTAGKALQAAGSNAAAPKYVRSLTKQGLVRAADTSTDQSAPAPIDPSAGLDDATKALLQANGDLPTDPNAAPTADELAAAGLGGGASADDPNDQFSPSNVKATIANMTANGSSVKEIKDYLDVAKQMQALTGSTGSAAKPLSSTALKQQATAKSGLDSLNQLESIIKDQGGVPKATVIPGRGLVGGAGARLLGTTSWDAASANVADSIIRMRTGAAATKQEMATFMAQLPQAGDPPEAVQQKLATVRSYLATLSNSQASPSQDNTELMAAYGQ